jgi:hypothetical protein
MLALTHAIANHLAATELDFIAINGKVIFNFQKQAAIAQAYPVTRRRSEHIGIGLSTDSAHT